MALKRLHYFKESLQFRFEALEQFIAESTGQLKKKQKELDKDLKSALSSIEDDEEQRYMIDLFLDDNLKYYDEFPKLLNDALFLIIYSVYETNMARIALLAKADINNRYPGSIASFPVTSYVQDSKKFLTTDCGISLNAKENIWRKLEKLRDYRNFITHNNSNLKQTKNAADKARKRQTVNYINRFLKKPLTVDSLEKCHIENPALLLTYKNLVKEYLDFIIDKGIKKSR